jgi:hypothetical protein
VVEILLGEGSVGETTLRVPQWNQKWKVRMGEVIRGIGRG